MHTGACTGESRIQPKKRRMSSAAAAPDCRLSIWGPVGRTWRVYSVEQKTFLRTEQPQVCRDAKMKTEKYHLDATTALHRAQ
jgi:hypothetical protein